MVLACDRVFNVVCSEQIDNVVTKGIIYEVLFTTETDKGIFYEMENDKGEYTRINAKYFMEVV